MGPAVAPSSYSATLGRLRGSLVADDGAETVQGLPCTEQGVELGGEVSVIDARKQKLWDWSRA